MQVNLNAVLLDTQGKPIADGPPRYELVLDADGKVVYKDGIPVPRVDADSKPIVRMPADDMTLKAVLFAALRTPLKDDPKTPDDATIFSKFILEQKLAAGAMQELDEKERSLLQERMKAAFPGAYVILYRVKELLADAPAGAPDATPPKAGNPAKPRGPVSAVARAAKRA